MRNLGHHKAGNPIRLRRVTRTTQGSSTPTLRAKTGRRKADNHRAQGDKTPGFSFENLKAHLKAEKTERNYGEELN